MSLTTIDEEHYKLVVVILIALGFVMLAIVTLSQLSGGVGEGPIVDFFRNLSDLINKFSVK